MAESAWIDLPNNPRGPYGKESAVLILRRMKQQFQSYGQMCIGQPGRSCKIECTQIDLQMISK